MNSSRMLVPVAVLAFAACGGRGEEAEVENVNAVGSPPGAAAEPPVAPPGTVDTAGVGTNPPTAGGQLVDTAAVPGPADTAQGTQTAP